MCQGSEHRYRLTLKVNGKAQSLVVYAKGVSDAIAKADGWAHINFPGEWIDFSIHRCHYSSDEIALDHGATL